MINITNLYYYITKKENFFWKQKIVFELKIPRLEIKTGEILGIYGANGSGKTTLTEIITGTKKIKFGLIEINDKEPLFSVVFQDSIFDDIKIINTLNFLNNANGKLANLDKLLIDFDLYKLKDHKFSELSFGQKQRFRFITTLLKPFSILILDEITTGMDNYWQKKIYQILQELIKNQKTVILISHNQEEIIKFCQNVIHIKEGQIIKEFYLTGNLNQKKQIFNREIKGEGIENEK